MVVTQIELEDEQWQKLQQISNASAVPVQEQIRSALRSYLVTPAKPRGELPPLDDALGKFEPLPSTADAELNRHDLWFTDDLR